MTPAWAGVISVAGLIVAGGLKGASPAICPLPSAVAYVGRNFSSGIPGPELKFGPAYLQTAPTREDVDKNIDRLAAFDYDERVNAARAVRRAPGTVALPALLDAAAGHADGYVRYRALVLLSGYDDPRVPDQMEQAMVDVNDRLRALAFAYFERHPDPRLAPAFVKALDKESAEFVRPALTRAMAAQGRLKTVQAALVKDLVRGPERFRNALIDALGDYKATYALKALAQAAELDGTSPDAVAIAASKMGETAASGLLAEWQHAAPAESPTTALVMCLSGAECDQRRLVLVRTLTGADRSPGYRQRLRTAAQGLATLSVNGDVEAGRALIEVGVTATDASRNAIACALAGLGVRQPATLVARLEERQDRQAALALIRDGFDRLEDDFGEEQFFVAVRTAYHAESEGSARRPLIQALINSLEF